MCTQNRVQFHIYIYIFEFSLCLLSFFVSLSYEYDHLKLENPVAVEGTVIARHFVACVVPGSAHLKQSSVRSDSVAVFVFLEF